MPIRIVDWTKKPCGSCKFQMKCRCRADKTNNALTHHSCQCWQLWLNGTASQKAKQKKKTKTKWEWETRSKKKMFFFSFSQSDVLCFRLALTFRLDESVSNRKLISIDRFLRASKLHFRLVGSITFPLKCARMSAHRSDVRWLVGE